MNRKLQTLSSAASLAAAAMIFAAPAHGIVLVDNESLRFDMEVHTVGRVQLLDHNANDKEAAGFARDKVSPGFQHAIGNIGWRLFWEDHIEVFFDLSLASRVYPDRVWGHQGYMTIKSLPEDSPLAFANPALDVIDVKAGHFIVDFGNAVHRRSLNADAQRNPLVGIPVVSPHATEAGVEVIHENPAGFGAMVGIGSGVATENFDSGSRFSYRGKIWGEVPNVPVNLAASVYHVDHGDRIARGSNLFRTDRLGGQYGGVWDDGGATGQVLIGDGTSLTAWQLDADWSVPGQAGLWAFFGRADDDRGATEESWWYYGITGQYYVMPEQLYLAARYSAADAVEFQSDSSNDGRMDRWQAGIGVWIMPGMLFKAEYVYQDASGFDHGALSGISLDQDPRFSGFITEVSYSF